MGGPPKLARWDYHSTHINLLYVLSTIVPEKNNRSMLQALADRWQNYMVSSLRSVFLFSTRFTYLFSFLSGGKLRRSQLKLLWQQKIEKNGIEKF